MSSQSDTESTPVPQNEVPETEQTPSEPIFVISADGFDITISEPLLERLAGE